LKETLVAPVSRIKIMIGRTLGGGTVAILQGLIILIISLFVGVRPENLNLLPLAVVFMALIALFFTALGTAIASVLEDMQGFQLIMNFLLMPLFFLSGALFPLQGLPRAFTIVASIDPLSYGVDGLRGTLVSGVHFGLGTDFIILGVITAIVLAIGSYLFSKIQI
jgi:ABC-2 type transport system permease protein